MLACTWTAREREGGAKASGCIERRKVYSTVEKDDWLGALGETRRKIIAESIIYKTMRRSCVEETTES